MPEVISYKNLEVCYDGRAVVQDISFSLAKGKVLCIVGESGSGKSTLLKAAMNLLGEDGTIVKGSIIFNGIDLIEMKKSDRQKLYGRHIAMIFQDAAASFCPMRTIGSQIYESLAIHMKWNKAEARENALALFHKIGLEDGARVWDSYPFELSGGMNQRAAVAGAMLMKPELLLADEPTSALDVCAQKQVLDEIKQLSAAYDTAAVIVTHDMGVAEYMADFVLVMRGGQAVEYGAAEEVLHNPQSDYTKLLLDAAPKLRRKCPCCK